MSENWSREEVEVIVSDYFTMMEKELRGFDYNKAEHNRQVRKLIPKRSRGSIEKKHQNISAVLWHLGYPYIEGYKPLPRYQTLLRNVIEEHLAGASTVNRLLAKDVRSQVKLASVATNLREIQVPPPRRKEIESLVKDEPRRNSDFMPRNYLETEARNQSLGLAGEELVLEFERERLSRAGKKSLASHVEHVSRTRGDYLGFDILSFEVDGRERLIEVKTTRYGAFTRFFASANEVELSHRRKVEYRLYRLFTFDRQPRFFVLAGSLRDTCQLKAANYTAVPL